MLERIHEIHLGTQKCMQRGRQNLLWPGMSNEIKELVSNCKTCLKYQSAQSEEPLIPYAVPAFPWQRIAADLFSLERINIC